MTTTLFRHILQVHVMLYSSILRSTMHNIGHDGVNQQVFSGLLLLSKRKETILFSRERFARPVNFRLTFHFILSPLAMQYLQRVEDVPGIASTVLLELLMEVRRFAHVQHKISLRRFVISMSISV